MSPPAPPSPVEASSFSYFCLEKKEKLCMGVSVSGEDHAEDGTFVQLKSYIKSVDKGLENRRMRWKLDEETGLLQLQDELANGGGPLCVYTDREYDDAKNITDVPLRLYKCPVAGENANAAAQVFTFNPKTGKLQTVWRGSKVCVLAYDCSFGPNTYFCRPRRQIAVDFQTNVIAGSYLGLAKCSNAVTSPPSYVNAQLFYQNTNCTMECSAEMLGNAVCDAGCNYELCEYDAGACKQEEAAPTLAPSIKAMTLAPTTLAPAPYPTLREEEVLNPPPPQKNEEANNTGMWIGVLLLLLSLCCCVVLVRRRRRRYGGRATAEEVQGLGEFVDEDVSAPPPPAPQSDKDHRPIASQQRERFETSSAVALNQLRYHSRPSNTGSSSSIAAGGKKLTNKNAAMRFEEVGLV